MIFIINYKNACCLCLRKVTKSQQFHYIPEQLLRTHKPVYAHQKLSNSPQKIEKKIQDYPKNFTGRKKKLAFLQVISEPALLQPCASNAM